MYKNASRFMQRSSQHRGHPGILGQDGRSFLQEVMRKLAVGRTGREHYEIESPMLLALRRAGITK